MSLAFRTTADPSTCSVSISQQVSSLRTQMLPLTAAAAAFSSDASLEQSRIGYGAQRGSQRTAASKLLPPWAAHFSTNQAHLVAQADLPREPRHFSVAAGSGGGVCSYGMHTRRNEKSSSTFLLRQLPASEDDVESPQHDDEGRRPSY